MKRIIALTLLASISIFSSSAMGANIDYYAANSPILQTTQDTDIVDFNTETHKFHDPSCIWAKRCTVHCIKITRAEALKRGGIPCKVCDG